MLSKSSHHYIQIDDNDCNLIQYRYEQQQQQQHHHQQQQHHQQQRQQRSEQQFFGRANDLLRFAWRALRTHSSLFTSIVVCALLGLSLITVIALVVYHRYRLCINSLDTSFASNKKDNNPNKHNLFSSNAINAEIILTSFERAVTIDTQCGKVIGVVEEDAFAFKGIPYALPPIGSLRWSRPIPMDRSNVECHKRKMNNYSYYFANQFALDCTQYNSTANEIIGSEDCLYLNIWTPRIDDSAKLSVMIYIHGSLTEGSGQQNPRPSGYLAHQMNAVFVSVNYRLNTFGFLALDLLANRNANSSLGNYGLWDIIVAIKWVRNNILAFGGDRDRITLFGADGDLILAILNNNEYSKLVKNAFIADYKQYVRLNFSHQAKYNFQYLIQNTNCVTVTCLLSMSSNHIINALFLQNSVYKQTDRNSSLIVIDGEIVFSTPTEELPKISILIIRNNNNNSESSFHSSVLSLNKFYIYLYDLNNNNNNNSGGVDYYDCGLLCNFFDVTAQYHLKNQTTSGQVLRKVVANFVNGNFDNKSHLKNSSKTFLLQNV